MNFYIDYETGNILSVQRALSHCHIDSKAINSSKELESIYLVLPGDGSFKFASDAFRKLKIKILDHVKKGKPLIGIGLGMQLNVKQRRTWIK